MNGAVTVGHYWLLAAVGVAAAALTLLLDLSGFAHGWLAAVVAWSAWPLGSLALLLAHALTGGRWGDALRPGLLAGVATLPLLPLLILPVLLTLPQLYPWVRDAAPNGWYLNVPFFAGRGVAYLLVWLGLAWVVLSGRPLEAVAAPGLLLLALTVTFASIDLTMSLQPRFVSSIYGMLSGAGAGVLALSAAILLAGVPHPVRNDVAKLLFALVLLWAYLSFMQVVIVWQNDLAEQVPWYKLRTGGGWGWVMALVAIGHGVAPMAVLLSARARHSARALAWVAAVLVGMSVLRAMWTVLPESPGVLPLLSAIACLAAVGGLAGAVALRHRGREAAIHA
ncbi:MAG: hypothetical protein ACRYHQ_00355 [Janthinobacterium lividum]